MKKRVFLKLSLLFAMILATSCQPVSEEAYYSALLASSDVPITLEEKNSNDNDSISDATTSAEDELDFADTGESLPSTSESEPEHILETVSPFDTEPVNSDSSMIVSPYGLCFDLTDGVLVYGKNIDAKIFPASITKLVTALVALKHSPDDLIFDIGNEVWMIETGSSTAALETGNSMDLTSILTALLVPSGNDAAYCVAANVSRYLNLNNNSEDENLSNDELVKNFISLMNEYILELGLQNSHFENPDGYHNDNHFSTLRDLLKISAAAAENPVISNICSLASPTVYYQSGKAISWTNRLPLLGDEEWGVMGLKTGFTDESLNSVSILSELNGKRYIAIVSGSETSNQRTADAQKLLSIVQNNYSEDTIIAYSND